MTDQPAIAPFVLVFNHNGMGYAKPDLEDKLAATYLSLLSSSNRLPYAILFYASGVSLACYGSTAMRTLRALEEAGVRLLVDQTSLEYFALSDDLAVGAPTPLETLLDLQWRAQKVITL